MKKKIRIIGNESDLRMADGTLKINKNQIENLGVDFC